MDTKSIYVTQPTLPPLEEYVDLLRDIWDRKWLTNKGHYHEAFEQQLAEYLGVKYVSLFCNGMIALQVGLQALKITGEVITTPYSFPATTHALWWNHCKPVFCDIDPKTCNLDPSKIESLVTPQTTAILPVHVYGTPCDVDAIQKIADTHGLKVLYDAAHAFGVRVRGQTEDGRLKTEDRGLMGFAGDDLAEAQRAQSGWGAPDTAQTEDGRRKTEDFLTTETTECTETTRTHPVSRISDPESRSILDFGDLSMLSFHATKVFNTAEGGALITDDPKLKARIDYLKNFGFAGETQVIAPGTNGKMSELQAALGVVQLRHVDAAIGKRLAVDRLYREQLAGIRGIRCLEILPDVQMNGAYFPIFVDEAEYGMSRDALYEKLKAQGIHGRRYFYPLISDFPMYRELASANPKNLIMARLASERVICLPMHDNLSASDIKNIVNSVCG